MNNKEFIDYIQNTLIPDLRSSGSHATADDFQRLVNMCGYGPRETEKRCVECNNEMSKDDFAKGNGVCYDCCYFSYYDIDYYREQY